MPGLLGNPPVARPMPSAAGAAHGVSATLGLKPDTSVGVGTSSVPYGPTNGYATPNGVTGFVGPAAGSLRQPTTWYVRATGLNTNGGSSAATSADRTGSDGATTSGSLTFTSASAAFTVADIGQGICIQNATFCYAKIVSVNSATSVQLTNPPSATASSLTWSIGGAWADPRPFLNCASFANTTCGVQSGDTVDVGGATYRQVYGLGANFGAAWNATGGTVLRAQDSFNGVVNIVGDVTGQYTGDAGMVQFTAYTTNDKTAPSGTSLLNLNGKSNLAFSNIFFVGGTAAGAITASTATSQNVTFTDCALIASGQLVAVTVAYGMQLNWRFDRCLFSLTNNSASIVVTLTTGGGGDYDCNFLVNNSSFLVGTTWGVQTAVSGAAAGKGGGVRIRNCSFLGCYALQTATNTSTSVPCTVTGSYICCSASSANQVLKAASSGQIVEDYNIILASTPRVNVTAGTHSISDGSYAPLFHFGQERIWGGLLRPFGEPMAGSPLLGFSPTGGGGPDTAPPTDLYGRWRPAGSATPIPAVGALERGNTAAQGYTSTTITWIADQVTADDVTGLATKTFVLPTFQPGDLVLIHMQLYNSNGASNMNASAPGWTQIDRRLLPNSEYQQYVFARFMQSGDGSPTFTAGGGSVGFNRWAGRATTYRNVASIDAAVAGQQLNIATAVSLGPLTLPANNELLLAFLTVDKQNSPTFAPSTGGTTTRYDEGGNLDVGGGTINGHYVRTLVELQEATSGSYSLAGTWSGNVEEVGVLISLQRGFAPPSGSSGHSWQGTGPWQQDFLLPVAAAADGFSIQVQRDTNYSAAPGGSNPTLEILANPAIGVAYQKITDTGAAAQWNTLTAAAFTPTAVGWVTVRITSYDGSGASVVSYAVANPS